VLTIQTSRFHIKTKADELMELTNEQLRAIKLAYANARGGSDEHATFVLADRLLLQRAGVVQ
jgi:hypothetical protein